MIQRPDLIADPRFADNPSRVINREALTAEIARIFAAQTRAEMVSRLEGHQLAWAQVSSVSDLVNHQALTRLEVDLGNGQSCSMPTSPMLRVEKAGRVPGLDEQGEAIRRDFMA